jgi:hypothetical protein
LIRKIIIKKRFKSIPLSDNKWYVIVMGEMAETTKDTEIDLLLALWAWPRERERERER